MIKTILMILKNRKEVNAFIKDYKEKQAKQHSIDNKDRLNLCYKHRQEKYHKIFAEHNCNHCNLEKKLKERDCDES